MDAYEKKRQKFEWRKWYLSTEWRAMRRHRLHVQPHCHLCMLAGRKTIANTVDHITPHRGNAKLFFNVANTQSLCARCHARHKQSEEVRGYTNALGADGWPTDPKHPVNRRGKPDGD